MTEELSVLKDLVKNELNKISGELKELSKRIFDNPELKFEEYKAMEWLTEMLEQKGFLVQRGVGGLDTSFLARCPKGGESGPTVAYLSEYDALPGLGHACGHNLISTIGLGAGLALCSVLDEVDGQVLIIGTPAEEGGRGKGIMVDAGVFEDVDVAMMVHPEDKTRSTPETSLGVQSLVFKFHGKASHASAAPEEGINALDAVIATFNNVNALREHIAETSRIHGVITNGGEKPNIVPEYAAANFYVRARELTELKELLERVKNCAQAGALSSGAELEITEDGGITEPLKPNLVLDEYFTRNMESLGEEVEKHTGGMKGSTDMGNVSQVVPAIHPYIKIVEEGTSVHTRDFATAANSEEGYSAMIVAAKALAMTGIDLLGDEEKFNAIKQGKI